MNKQLVFVYGTLRKHQRNHHLLSGATCLASQCWTVGKLIDSEFGYPYLVPSASGRVYGEIYQVDQLQLKALDTLEGYHGPKQNNYYLRTKQLIHTDTESYEAFVYIFSNEKLTRNLMQIKNGDWSVNQLLNQNQSLFYFAYGSCMDDVRFRTAGVNHYFQKVIGFGILDGYTLRFTKRSHDGGRADIVEEPGTVEGKVYEIPLEALSYLYRREGVNAGCYRPALIDITINGRAIKNVFTFVVVDKEPETAPPNHYIEEILRGGHGFLSADYMEKLRKQLKENFNLED
ncbi:gamma-glutamylcyclotransferase [Neobacillus sp. NPDC097160]|uniref:gamma-glutamylcyclotransferase n=1 Tax=Neobacillus sp. NPDC097160 TaxID=3364298 RepID=UPI003802C0CB